MAIRSRDEIMERIKNYVGDSSDDDTIEFVSDLTDTINNYEKSNCENVNWKQKFDENDKMWREKYKERFFSTPAPEKGTEEEETNVRETPLTYNNLFREEK